MAKNKHKKQKKEATTQTETKKEDTNVKLKNILLVVIAGLLLVNIYLYLQYRGAQDEKTPTGGVIGSTLPAVTSTVPKKVKLDFYVMSQCPYGMQVENVIKPVLDKLGESVDFNLNFIASDLGDGTFQSLHGQPEVDENIRQLCAIKHYPQKYMDYIVCRNKNIQSEDWQACAESSGMDSNVIKTCFDGGEGKRLHSESIIKSENVGAMGSPTIYVNDKAYQSGRDSLSFMRVLCAELGGHPGCADIPECGNDLDCPPREGKISKCENPNKNNAKCTYVEDTKVDFIVLNDKTCSECDTEDVIGTTKSIFPAVQQRNIDISSAEGKKLIDELKIIVVPAYIFDSNLEKTYMWENNPNIRGFFEKIGDKYKLLDKSTGATHFVSEEVKQKYYEMMGVTLGDNRPQIDFYVMSFCPYGNQAEEAIEPVYQVLKDKADFNPHYVIYANYGGGGPNFCLDGGKYCSMHGIGELNQDIRELCVNKYMGTEKYFGFVLAVNEKCDSTNVDSCWESVAADLGLNTTNISSCEKNEGIEIAKKEKELNDLLGVSGSPTVFIDGQQYSGSRTPAVYQAALCDAFETKPDECSKIIEGSGESSAPSTGQC